MHQFNLWTLFLIAGYILAAYVLAKNAMIEARRFYWLAVAMLLHHEVLPHVSQHFGGLSARTILIVCAIATIGCLFAMLCCLRQIADLVAL
jgi:hypothetical protein